MLRNQIINLRTILFLGTVTMAMTSCLKDLEPNDPIIGGPKARIEITDAPIDDPNVKGVFVTVVDVKIDGVSWAGFDGKSTFDLLAYQRGQTKLLGEGVLDVDTYNEIVLVLDTDTDAHGDSPGCYVKDSLGIKRKLEGGNQMVVKAKGVFSTKTDNTTNLVVDIDLRKSIVYKSGSTTEYQFVTDPELYAAVRLMDKDSTGNIIGDCTDGVSGSDKIIVYAYKIGEYGVNEKFPQGSSQVQFKNSVTSSPVEANGAFQLAFLESGAYELHFISYQENAQGNLVAKGELQLSVIGPVLNLLNLTVAARQTINIDVAVIGIVFF